MSALDSHATIEAQSSSPSIQPQPDYQYFDYLALLGHPHDIAEPQQTEPFWQQYPDQPNARNFYYELEDIYTATQLYYTYQANMSFEQPLIIGYGAGNRGVRDKKPERPRRTKEIAKVWLGNEEVGEIGLSVLTRFSKYAKLAFPRAQPGPANDTKTTPAIKSTSTAIIKSGTRKSSINWADDNDDEPFLPVSEKLEASKTTAKVTNGETPKEGTSAPASRPSTSTTKDFFVGVHSYIQPALAHVKYILSWMELNKGSLPGDALLPITPTPLPSLSDQNLLDTYVAVLAFNLTPFPHALRHEILTRMSNVPVQLKQLQYTYDRLPEGDPIVNRLVTSILEHEEAKRYTEEEYTEIWNYAEKKVEDGGVDDGGKLKDHFARVERSRKRKAKEAEKGVKRGQTFDKLKSGFEAIAGPDKAALPIAEGHERAQGGRKRDRRQQQANGKAAAAAGKSPAGAKKQ